MNSPGNIGGIVTGRAVTALPPLVPKVSSISPAFAPEPAVAKLGALFS